MRPARDATSGDVAVVAGDGAVVDAVVDVVVLSASAAAKSCCNRTMLNMRSLTPLMFLLQCRFIGKNVRAAAVVVVVVVAVVWCNFSANNKQTKN